MNPRLRAFIMLSFSLELGLAVSPLTRVPAIGWVGVIATVAGLSWGIAASLAGTLVYVIADGWLPFMFLDWTLAALFLVLSLVSSFAAWALLRKKLAPYRRVWASLNGGGVKR